MSDSKNGLRQNSQTERRCVVPDAGIQTQHDRSLLTISHRKSRCEMNGIECSYGFHRKLPAGASDYLGYYPQDNPVLGGSLNSASFLSDHFLIQHSKRLRAS